MNNSHSGSACSGQAVAEAFRPEESAFLQLAPNTANIHALQL